MPSRSTSTATAILISSCNRWSVSCRMSRLWCRISELVRGTDLRCRHYPDAALTRGRWVPPPHGRELLLSRGRASVVVRMRQYLHELDDDEADAKVTTIESGDQRRRRRPSA